MHEYQSRFIEFVIEHEILRFGSFTLKSGRQSPYFFNAGLFDTGSKLSFLARCYAEAIQRADCDYDLLFGPAYKGIPLVAATAAALADVHGIDKPFCFNRKEAKDHGERGMIVGAPLVGRALIIDDVITAGTSVQESLELFEASGALLAGIVVAVDRMEKTNGELSAIQEIERRHGVSVHSIVSLPDIIHFLESRSDREFSQHIDGIRRYQQQYGAG
ncbi:MAG: orotate phosphoribosyltransferase [Pseudohongiellaceae bacterium]